MGVYLNEKARAFDVAVLHDLRNPNPRYGGANIDEVVCWADDRHVTHVQILDTKAWKPGLYWTFGGKNKPVEATDVSLSDESAEATGR